mgnify:CR=1 FL=1
MKVSKLTLVVLTVFCLNSLSAQLDWMVANKHYEMGEYELAVDSYKSIVENGNADESTMVRMADALRHMGRLTEAADWYGQVASMEKPSKEFIFQYAQTLKSLGKYEEAIKFLERAWSLDKNPEIAAHLGEVLWVSGERDKAMQIWREGQAQQADNRILLETLERLDIEL